MKTTIENKVLATLRHRSPGKVSTVVLARSSGSFAVSTTVSRWRSRGYKIKCTKSDNPEKKYFYKLENPKFVPRRKK